MEEETRTCFSLPSFHSPRVGRKEGGERGKNVIKKGFSLRSPCYCNYMKIFPPSLPPSLPPSPSPLHVLQAERILFLELPEATLCSLEVPVVVAGNGALCLYSGVRKGKKGREGGREGGRDSTLGMREGGRESERRVQGMGSESSFK